MMLVLLEKLAWSLGHTCVSYVFFLNEVVLFLSQLKSD